MKIYAASIVLISFLFNAVFALPKTAFDWDASHSGNTAVLRLEVAKDHYVYVKSLKFDFSGGPAVLSAPVPKLQTELDGTKVEVFPSGKWEWKFQTSAPLLGKLEYQGCGKDGMCFMPETVAVNSQKIVEKQSSATADKFKVIRSAAGFMDQDGFIAFLQNKKTENLFDGAGVIAVILLTLLGGLSLNLTPCILPMMPINLAIIGASGGRTGFMRGLFYGIGMALVYGVLGLLAALAGVGFGTLNSSPWFNLAVGAVFIYLALAMAGIFNLNFSGLVSVRTSRSGNLTALAFGALAALLAGACVAPVLISVLLFSAEKFQDGSVWAIGLPFVLGIGMAIPWPLAGLGLSVLPRPGKFMVYIKYAMSVIIAAMGIYYAVQAWKLYGNAPAAEKDGFMQLEKAAELSKRNSLPILVEFTASWCKNCAVMERDTLNSPEVKAITDKDFIFVRFPAEDPDEPETAALLRAWNVQGFPAFVIVQPIKKSS